MKKCIALFLVFVVACLNAQTEPNVLDFKLLRQYDNIQINQPNNAYLRLKQISLGDSTSLSLGGSYRFQAESFINEEFSKDVAPTKFWLLHRILWHAHLKVNDKLQLFGELNSSLATNKEHTSPVDKDELNVNQLFAQYNFNKHWHLLVGRQTMRLGSGRLVDPREGPNVRLSFDMAEVQFQDQNTTIKAFYSIPVQQKPGVFDNESLNTDETLSGLYWTQQWQENTHTDAYVLYKEEANKTWNVGTARDRRATIGVRAFGQWNGIDYNNEFMYQLGTFGNQDIHAWAASLQLEKSFETNHPFTVGIKTDIISGDKDKNDNFLDTFDGLYPRGAYFGKVAYFGPSNLIDIHPYYSTRIGKVGLELDYEAFWRYSKEDGIYNPPLILSYPDTNNKKFLAHQIGAVGAYKINKFMTVELESNIIFPAAFLKASGLDKTLYHFVLTTQLEF